MNNYYFTFGYGSKDFIKITASSEPKAREIMFENYGDKWAFNYDEKHWKGQEEKYGLTLLKEFSEANL